MAEKKKQVKGYAAGKYCPKCGPGTKLGVHNNRVACGKCRYTEMADKT